DRGEPIHAAARDVEHHDVGRITADRDQRVDRLGECPDLEPRGERTLQAFERGGILVDHLNARTTLLSYVRPRIALLAQESEDIDPTEAQVPAGGAKVPNLAAISPVMDCLEIDLTKLGDLRSREQLLGLTPLRHRVKFLTSVRSTV